MIIYTLSELTCLIKDTLSHSFPDTYWVTAEIARIKLNHKGHCYLELVEKSTDTSEPVARINANIWAYNYRNLVARFEGIAKESLKQGMKVLLLVTVKFHEVYGLSLNIIDIDPTYSLGEMARRRREVIERLKKDDLIDCNKRLALPMVPQRIAIVSSPTAAGYEDFINHLKNNTYGYSINSTLFPSLMQGEEAEESIIMALRDIKAQSSSFDLVAIIRGGGSQVDLSCFDSYNLASKVALLPIPVITGIGHERDETVVDMVAHTRLKTPTAVAEFIISGIRGFEERLINFQRRLINTTERMIKEKSHMLIISTRCLSHSLHSYINNRRHALKRLAFNLKYRPIQIISSHYHRLDVNISGSRFYTERIIHDSQNRLLETRRRLNIHLRLIIQKQEEVLKNTEQALKILDPLNVLKRGYSITFSNGKVLKDIQNITKGDKIWTRIYKGAITSTVNSAKEVKNG